MFTTIIQGCRSFTWTNTLTAFTGIIAAMSGFSTISASTRGWHSLCIFIILGTIFIFEFSWPSFGRIGFFWPWWGSGFGIPWWATVFFQRVCTIAYDLTEKNSKIEMYFFLKKNNCGKKSKKTLILFFAAFLDFILLGHAILIWELSIKVLEKVS